MWPWALRPRASVRCCKAVRHITSEEARASKWRHHQVGGAVSPGGVEPGHHLLGGIDLHAFIGQCWTRNVRGQLLRAYFRVATCWPRGAAVPRWDSSKLPFAYDCCWPAAANRADHDPKPQAPKPPHATRAMPLQPIRRLQSRLLRGALDLPRSGAEMVEKNRTRELDPASTGERRAKPLVACTRPALRGPASHPLAVVNQAKVHVLKGGLRSCFLCVNSPHPGDRRHERPRKNSLRRPVCAQP